MDRKTKHLWMVEDRLATLKLASFLILEPSGACEARGLFVILDFGDDRRYKDPDGEA